MEYFVYHFQVFMLIMARMLGLFMIAPFFSSQSIRFSQRALLAFLITTICFPMVQEFRYAVPGHIVDFGVAAVSEAIVGIIIGFLISLALTTFQMAGQFFSVQIGFGMSEVVDPMSQTSIPVVGTLYNLMGIFIFLVIGGHYLLIEALIFSYQKIQFFALSPVVNEGLFTTMQAAFGSMFLVALKMAFPLLGTLFLASVTMGLVSKAAPQMNILMMGFPVNIIIAFTLLLALSPVITEVMQDTFYVLFDKIDQMQNDWPAVQ